MYTRKMAANFNFAQVLVLVVVAAAAVGKTFAATYVVGDSVGWTIPSGGASTYSTWASQHTFRVGDILVFNFPSGVHDVATVPKSSFDGCTSSNPISLVTVGPASITLASAGAVYYICTFGQHCSLGQKLAINVTGGAPTSPPAAAPSPRTTPPPSPTPSPTPAPPTVAPTPSAPTPAPTPSAPTPAPTPSAPTPAPTPSSSPAPTPGEAQTPPSTSPSPGGAGGGGGAGSPPVPTPAGTLSPPPPPNSASATATATFLAVLAVTFVTSLVC